MRARSIAVPGRAASRSVTKGLAEAGLEAFVDSRGDSYDNAPADSVIGLFKTDVEYATLEWRLGSTPSTCGNRWGIFLRPGTRSSFIAPKPLKPAGVLT
jgi:transposase InsO family protein